jgi:hypothetical protein
MPPSSQSSQAETDSKPFPLASVGFILAFAFQPRRLRQYILPKRLAASELHEIILRNLKDHALHCHQSKNLKLKKDIHIFYFCFIYLYFYLLKFF